MRELSFTNSIEVVLNDLKEEQLRLLEQWETLSSNTNKWMKDIAARVQAQDSPTPDLDLARAQKQEMEVSNVIICAV